MTQKAVIMEWYKGVLCIGLQKEYILFDVETGEITPMFPLEKSTVPIIKLLSDDVLLAKDGEREMVVEFSP